MATNSQINYFNSHIWSLWCTEVKLCLSWLVGFSPAHDFVAVAERTGYWNVAMRRLFDGRPVLSIFHIKLQLWKKKTHPNCLLLQQKIALLFFIVLMLLSCLPGPRENYIVQENVDLFYYRIFRRKTWLLDHDGGSTVEPNLKLQTHYQHPARTSIARFGYQLNELAGDQNHTLQMHLICTW